MGKKEARREEGFLHLLEKSVRLDGTEREDSDSNPVDRSTQFRRSDEAKFGPTESSVEGTVRGRQLRQLRTVATLGGVSQLPSIFAIFFYPFLSDRWTMMMMNQGTERLSGRSDHDPSDLVVEGTTTRVTWWSK